MPYKGSNQSQSNFAIFTGYIISTRCESIPWLLLKSLFSAKAFQSLANVYTYTKMDNSKVWNIIGWDYS